MGPCRCQLHDNDRQNCKGQSQTIVYFRQAEIQIGEFIQISIKMYQTIVYKFNIHSCMHYSHNSIHPFYAEMYNMCNCTTLLSILFFIQFLFTEQVLIKCSSSTQQKLVFDQYLRGHIKALVQSKHCNFAVQRILTCWKDKENVSGYVCISGKRTGK